jgi:hypothetical protein
MAYAGMDRSTYPSDDVMAVLKSELSWTGFYLAPAPNHSDQSWMVKRDVLVAQRWGIAPVYLGRQAGSPNLTPAVGSQDADAAIALANVAGFPAPSVIFLDFEGGDAPSGAALAYYQAWVQRIIDVGFTPGIYCSYLTAGQFIAADGRPTVWATRQRYHKDDEVDPPYSLEDPSDCGYAGAKLWQYALDVKTTVNGVAVEGIDFSTSTMADPTQPLEARAV